MAIGGVGGRQFHGGRSVASDRKDRPGTLRAACLAAILLSASAAAGQGSRNPEMTPGLWTWESGSNEVAEQPQWGRYGVIGVAGPENVPGARYGAVTWTDASGGGWLFGGEGYSASGYGRLNDLWKYDSGSGHWTWMGGAAVHDQYGTYGTKGVPASGNAPGARYGSVSWTDGSGFLWLFGGEGLSASGSGMLNDLWKLDTGTMQWAWMGGSDSPYAVGSYGTLGTPAPENVPGARYFSVSWTDGSGDLWLFGGQYASNRNDLWRYSPGTGLWTWMGGSADTGQYGIYGTLGTPAPGNVPGARSGAASWTDGSGKRWLFGGVGNAATSAGYLNDLWKYDPETGWWTWMGGANQPYQEGTYGTLGTPAAGNVPGARVWPLAWRDPGGSLWLFGGDGFSGTFANRNDLWKYDPGTGLWTWMGGSNVANQYGSYGSRGIPSAANIPGARVGSVRWGDGSGNLWLFGGAGNATHDQGRLNDVWKYDLGNGQWTWMGGPSDLNRYGRYGVLGTPAAENAPGARGSSVSWRDGSGNLWLFGGYGFSESDQGCLSDLWRYDPATRMWTWMYGSRGSYQEASHGTLGTPSAANDPGNRSASASWIDGAGNFWLFGGNSGWPGAIGERNDLWKYEPGIGQWTWMSGSYSLGEAGTYGTPGTPAPGNVPGARSFSVSWSDGNGHLWLFGGHASSSGFSSAHVNDLWRFDTGTGLWTWMSGSSLSDQYGSYGSLGVPAQGNVPGARERAVSWMDENGDFWLFGGSGYAASSQGYLNDLWRYEVGTGMWTWMSGSDAPYHDSVYGTPGIPAPGNAPGARLSPVTWTDGNGNLWLFGGFVYPASGPTQLNDLWKFDRGIGQWSWMGGANVAGQSGTYGTLGAPAAGNISGARTLSVAWTGENGRFWLFGGFGLGTTPVNGSLGDLWSYTVCAPIPAPAAGTAARCGSGPVTLSASGAGPGQDYRWYDAATGGTLLQSIGSSFVTVPISSTTTYYVSIYDTTTSCESDRAAVTADVLAGPLTTTAFNDGPVCAGATLHLESTIVPGAAYSWTGPNGFTSTDALPSIANVSALAAGPYEVTVSATGCVPAVASTTVVVKPRPAAPVIAAPASVGAGSGTHTASVAEHAGATYRWGITNGTITAGQGSSSITFSPAAVGTLGLTVVEQNPAGCDSVEASATVPVLAAPTQFHVVAPCRLFDTRHLSGPDSAAPVLAAGETRTFAIGGRCGLPANAVALSVNVTVTGPAASGALMAFRADLPSPSNVTTIAFPAGRTRANNGILELAWDGSATFKVRNDSPGTAHFILDVNGVFR